MRSLLKSSRRWKVKQPASGLVEHIAQTLGCSRALAEVLASRAAGEPQKLLSTNLEDLNSPEDLAGVAPAIERLERALKGGEKIFIHGDFDVDGLTSAALLYLGLKEAGLKELKVEIEDRERGHGLNPEVAQRVIKEGFKLLITSDCGISDFEEVKALQESGVDVIITDHHHPPSKLPPAVAVINPKQASCKYPNKELAAVGVAFQLIRGLYQHLGISPAISLRFLDLVMLGTVADLVPLVKEGQVENKILVAAGLEMLASGEGSLGLRTLIEKLSLDPKNLTAGEIGYILAPKLNAANRVGDPRVAFLLLTTQNKQKAQYWAEILLDYNQDRQIAQDDLRYQAEELIRQGEVDFKKDKIIILEGKYWNPGIIGLVASDLVEKYYLPTILISRGDRESRASGRSILEFDLIESLARIEHLFEGYGGHRMAAGFTIKNENIPTLKQRLREYAQEKLADLSGPTPVIDSILTPQEITLRLYEEVQRLAPFGIGNPEPRFLMRKALIKEAQTVGSNGQHLKLKVRADNFIFEAIGFDMGEDISRIYGAGEVALVFKLEKNTWLGEAKVQLELEDVLEPIEL